MRSLAVKNITVLSPWGIFGHFQGNGCPFQSQNKAMDIEYCLAGITVAALECMRLELDCFCDQFEKKCSTHGLTEWSQTTVL